MSRVTSKAPYYTTFRCHVRRWSVEASPEIPFEMVQDWVRSDLNERKHSIIETSWKDVTGQTPEDWERNRTRRVVSVRYVTGGMRHGLGASTDIQPQVGLVEFARAHGPGFGR
jgi:hypothetical protein